MFFVDSGEDSSCFDEDVHPFFPSFVLSTRVLILHLRIPISYSSLLLPLIYLFILSTWMFLPYLRIFNIFHFTTASFHFLICDININVSCALTHSNILLFATDCFTQLWYVNIKFWIGGVTSWSTCSGRFIHKTSFFGEGLYVTSLFFFRTFFLYSVFQFYSALCFLNWSVMIISIERHFSFIYNPFRLLNIHCTQPKNIWLQFHALSFRISMSYLPWLRGISYCSNNSSLFSILMHGKCISKVFKKIWWHLLQNSMDP